MLHWSPMYMLHWSPIQGALITPVLFVGVQLKVEWVTLPFDRDLPVKLRTLIDMVIIPWFESCETLWHVGAFLNDIGLSGHLGGGWYRLAAGAALQ